MASLCRILLLVLCARLASAQFYIFCAKGVAEPDFSEQRGVDVIIMQAPLFSTNPTIGDKLGYINLYHTAIAFAQGIGAQRRYWTMEFDYTGGSILTSVVPKIVENLSPAANVSFEWSNDARFCVTEGLMWGRKHWSKRFEVIASLTVAQSKQVFREFVWPTNSSQQGAEPQYQLLKVAKLGLFGRIQQTLVPDMTCNDGVAWFLHYLSTLKYPGAQVNGRLQMKGTHLLVEAHSVEPVNTSDSREWSNLVQYYRTLTDLAAANKSLLSRIVDVSEVVSESKYVYDSGIYYRLIGNYFPWFIFVYVDIPLVPPPWIKLRDESEARHTAMEHSAVVV